LVDVPGAAKLLGLTAQKTHKLIRSGKIPSVRLGRRTVRVSTEILKRWAVENSTANGKTTPIAEFGRDPLTGRLVRVGS